MESGRDVTRRPGPGGLVFAATARCHCGAGLAYEKEGPSGDPIAGWWSCWLVLRAREPRGTQHVREIAFADSTITPELVTPRGEITTHPGDDEW